MDNQTEQQNGETDIPLGAGVDIVQQNDSDDVEIESYDDNLDDNGGVTPQEQMKRLREKLRVCVEEKKEYLDGWQRTKADFINFKKRTEEEKGDFLKFAREGIITDLLPVLESFHMAFANKAAWEKVDPAWRMGVEHIHTQLSQTLAAYGLVAVDPIGQDFNPNEETSIGTVPTDDVGKHHKVAEVLQLGYKLQGKLIKSPQVKIYADPASHAEHATDGS